jgi:predicted dehydrogenase
MIHDLNLVNGLLRAMGVARCTPTSASIFARGRGTAATMALNEGQALCQLAHVVVPELAEYNERISLFFDDSRFELVFPSPYLHNFQTALIRYRSEGHRLEKTVLSNGYGEPFVRELEGFHDSIVNGAPVRNTAEDAREDMVLVRQFMRLALKERQELGSAHVHSD